MPTIAETIAQAKTYHMSGDLHSAEQFYRRVLEADSAHVEALYLLGATCHGLAKVEEAKASLAQAVRLKPDYADAHHHLGVVFAEQGQLDEAIASFQQALRLRPNSSEISKNLRHALAAKNNNLGDMLRAQGKLEEAASCYRRALGGTAGLFASTWKPWRCVEGSRETGRRGGVLPASLVEKPRSCRSAQ